MGEPFRIPRSVVLWIFIIATATPIAAHPVAQGAMDILVMPDSVIIAARVANEQVFVAEALGTGRSTPANLNEAWLRHGDYLLEHIRVSADDVPLAGRVVDVRPPATSAADARTSYEFRFDFPKDKLQPRRVVFHQDVLNEIQFAPGNRWEATYVVRLGQKGGPVHEGLLFTAQQALAIDCDWSTPPTESAAAVLNKSHLFREYLHHGVMHILTGYDHLLFIAALVLAAVTFMDLAKVVTAFTLAHTITLTLSVLDLVRLSSRIVEPMIAASIVVVALQNVFWPERSRGWTRYALAFAFGLFHGLGFAGGLLAAMEAMPGIAIVLAIVAFSIGVELGHSAVVAPLFAALRLGDVFTGRDREPRHTAGWAVRLGSAAIGFAGMFYLVASLR